MAKHVWEIVARDRRRCRACGREQEQTTSAMWMRVTGSRWMPKVGRCPGPRRGDPARQPAGPRSYER